MDGGGVVGLRQQNCIVSPVPDALPNGRQWPGKATSFL
jgi:hypothetical protein